jgi:acetyl esterase/lipase
MKKILLLIVAMMALTGAFGVWAQADAPAKPAFTRTEDVLYGRKFGTALTLDVFEPREKNGAAILFMVSGGFFSAHESINGKMYAPFLERGYTVFAIVHGSQPKFQIPEITQDIHRAVRFVRHNAQRWGVDPDKFGITGGSAGGHLSLTMGTQGKPGKADAKDPVDRASSAVQAVACFFPPTDFLNYGEPGEDAVGIGTLKQFKPAFGAKSDTAEGRQELGREISPVNFITSNMPPTLIIHGDADKLVPLYQAQRFEAKCKEVGAPFKLITKPGVAHGWAGMEKDYVFLADWFDEHLRGLKPKQ